MSGSQFSDLPLVGREAETHRLRTLVTATGQGRSGVLVVRGEPGIGKTALLATAARTASAMSPGTALLSARCMEREGELAFSALSALLSPAADLISRLPVPQRRALGISLALTAPGPSEEAPSGIAIGLGTLALLAEAAPAVVLLDDIQWMDEASAAALSFAARRLLGEGVAVFLAVRSGIPCPMDLTGHPVLELAALSCEATHELANRVHGGPLGLDEIQRLMLYTGGNPLAVMELSRSGLPPLDAGRNELPLPPPQAVTLAYRDRLAPLSTSTRSALLVCAASHHGELTEITAALGRTGLADLESAESAGLITLGHDRIGFVHPLMRAAVYHLASPAQRRAAHALLAQAHRAHGDVDKDEHAWHLAAAALGTDEEAARALTEVAERARRRGALGPARTAYARAAELSPQPEPRARRMVAAAASAQLAGLADQALLLLSRARATTGRSELISEIEQLRNQILLTRGAPQRAFVQMTESAAALRDQMPTAAADLLATAAGVGVMGGMITQGLTAAEEGYALACTSAGGDSLAPTVLRVHTLLLVGRTRAAGELLNESLEQLLAADPLAFGAEVFGYACMDLMWLDQHHAARRLMAHGLGRVRGANAGERLTVLLSVQAELEFRHGRWNAAYAAAAECMSLAEELRQPVLVGYAAGVLAQIEAAHGQRQRCTEYANRVLSSLETIGYELVSPYALLALAQLESNTGHYSAAAARLTALKERMDQLGLRNPAVLPFHADLVEACLHANRLPEAKSALAAFADTAGPTAPDTVRAALARCRGLLAADVTAAQEHFAAALALYDTPWADAYGLARTRFAFGRRLRRARQRADAQTHLEAARVTFQQLGAVPWVDRVDRELRVAGSRRVSQDSYVELTTQELQVARLVAGGATNREAADALFLSHKTIEYHLRNIYTKLNLRSRVELSRRLADTAFGPTALQHDSPPPGGAADR